MLRLFARRPTPLRRRARRRAGADAPHRPRAAHLHSAARMEPPRGTVTFLFSDVEGSTGLVEQLGPRWGAVLADIRRLLREAAAESNAYEVDCRGDEHFFAFADAHSAVDAAAAGQRALREHEWPEGVSVRVRMGLHTGEPEVGEEGYVGIDVHRVARICSAGHGGQVLMSQTTAGLAREPVVDMGEHELVGLPKPERLFQLVVHDLPAEFPPLRGTKELGGPTIRAVLADDSVLLREGVARLLGETGVDIVAQSGTADDLLRHVAMHKPDVAIVDIRMPPTHTDEGLRAAQSIRERFPDVGVLVLSQYVESAYALELLSQNAEGVGYLLKDRVSDVDEFAAAVRRVAEGGSALDPAVVQMLVGRRRDHDPLDELTPREREVLELMAEGRSNQAISERLFVTPRAVEKHVTSIFNKLRLPASSEDHRRVLAVLAYLRA
jgi:DNA-binding NarL/FixJ family response regulator/class 3 adenylate cyclase